MLKNYYPSFKTLVGLPLAILTALILLSASQSRAAAPVVDSVVHPHGIPGDTVMIYGSNFNATAANNIVFFGATKAYVATASTSQLKVAVPLFALNAQITVLNTATHLIGFEHYPFMPEFDNTCFIPGEMNFRPEQHFTAGASSTPYTIALGDIDGDGLVDAVAMDWGPAGSSPGAVRIYRNTSTPGSVSFASGASFATLNNPLNLKLVDLDGDGRLDVVVAGTSYGRVSLFRNLSTSGTITMSSRTDIQDQAGSGPTEVVIADFDGDGRPDIAYTVYGVDSVGVIRNRIYSPLGAAAAFPLSNFAHWRTFVIDGTTGADVSWSLAAADFDGDGKPDIATSNSTRATVSILRNTATIDTIDASSFATHFEISAGTAGTTNPYEIQAADIDGDGKPDLVIANYGTGTLNTGGVGLFRNQSSVGSISFGSEVIFTTTYGCKGLGIGDFDGDGKLDVAASIIDQNTISVYRNLSTPGSLNTSSLVSSTNLYASVAPVGVTIGDVDGDKKPDIVTANSSTTHSFSVLLNNPLPYVAIVQGNPNLCIGTAATLSDSISGGTWSTSNNTVATIEPTTGIIHPLALGIDTVTYMVICQGDTNYAYIEVSVSTTPTVNAISGATHMCNGSGIPLTETTTGGIWSTSNSAVSTVNSSGSVFSVSAGQDTIFYSKSNACGTTRVHILDTVFAQPTTITGSFSLCAGTSLTLSDTVAGGTWSSSATGVATINPVTGQVNSLTRGTSTITYRITPGGCFATANITVDTLPIIGAISGASGVCNGYSTVLSDTTIGGTWSTATGGHATVNATGQVTGLTPGTATITYSKSNGCGTNFALFTITVNNNPSAIGGSLSVCPGTSSSLTDTAGGGFWTISGGHATIVSSTGVITGSTAGTGTVTFTLTAGGCFVTAGYTVYAPPATISAGSGTNVCAGSTLTYSESSTGGVWSSSDTTRAIIDGSSGMITGRAAGSAIISYSIGTTGCYVTQPVTVNALPSAITGASSVCVGSIITLTDGSGGGIWTSSNTSIATVVSSSGTTGNVTGVSAGTTVIKFQFTSTLCYVTDTITVNPVPTPITGPSTVCVGSTINLADTSSGGSWSSATGTNATVSTSGVVTGVASGTESIFYSYTSTTGCRAVKVITVNPLPVAISGTTTICQGILSTLTDGSGTGTWISGNTTVATINSGGVVTAVLPGTSIITFTLPTTCSITTTVTVNPAPAPIVGPSTVCVGATISLTDSTTGGTWSSSGSAATTDTIGVVTGHTPGTVAIIYSSAALGCFRVDSITVMPIITPLVSISTTPGLTVCAGTPVTYTATPVNGGSAPVYTWSVNGGFVGTGYTYTFAPSNGNLVKVKLNSNAACAIPDTASSSVVMTVNPLITPSVNLNILLGDTVCLGSPTTVHAYATNGGSSPTYQWRVNNVPVGGTNSFGYTPANGDIVTVAMESNANCRAVDTARDTLTITVSPYVSPSVILVGSDTACAGHLSVFTAVPVNGGMHPNFQWIVNSGPVSTSNPYAYGPLTGDRVSVILTSDFACVNYTTAYSDTLTMTTFPVLEPTVKVIVTPGFIVAPGMTAHFTGLTTNGGDHPTYQWYRNYTPIPGATDTIYSTNAISNHDSFSMVIINHDVCNNIRAFDHVTMVIGNNVGVSTETLGSGIITVIPNPNTGRFNVKGDVGVSADEDLNIEVTNMLGQVVYRDVIRVKNGSVDEGISLDNSLSNGMYLLNLRSPHVSKVIHFVIEK